MSLDCMDLVTNLSLPAGLGVGKGGIELSHGPGHVVPGNVRGGKEAWLVWVLSGLVDFLPFKFCCSVYTMCLFGRSVVFQMCALVSVNSSEGPEGGFSLRIERW